MKKVMFEVEWVYNDEEILIDVKVHPITVTRIGILPGCYLPSITATGRKGQFIGALKEYFETEQEALDSTVTEIKESIKYFQDKISSLESQKQSLITQLNSMGKSNETKT